MKLELFRYPSCRELEEEFYIRMEEEVGVAINRRTVEVNTLVRQSGRLEENAIRNIAFLAEAVPLKDLAGAFPGVPGIIVAAGPSLAEDLPALEKAAGKAVFISVGKALNLLVERGIRPQFTAALDMVPSSRRVFEGYDIPAETALVFDHDCHHEVTRIYPHTRIGYATNINSIVWADSIFGPLGELKKGLSVAHTAFFFARALGLDPIILSGVDLAFPGERTHAEGVTMTWGGKVDPQRHKMIEIPCVKGGMVRSLKSFLSFVSAFEVEIENTPAKVIHTSPAGAAIRGTENRPLSEVVEGLSPMEADVAGKVAESASRRRSFPREEFEKGVGDVRADLERLVELCESGLRILGRMKRLDPLNKMELEEIRRRSRKLEQMKGEIKRLPAVKLLSRLLSGDSLEISRLVVEAQAIKDTSMRYRADMKTFRVLFEGYEKAVASFRGPFEAMVQEVRERQEKKHEAG